VAKGNGEPTLGKRKTWRPDSSHGPVELLHATDRTMKSEGKIELRRKPVALDCDSQSVRAFRALESAR